MAMAALYEKIHQRSHENYIAKTGMVADSSTNFEEWTEIWFATANEILEELKDEGLSETVAEMIHILDLQTSLRGKEF